MIGGLIDGLMKGFTEYKTMSKEMKLRKLTLELEAKLSAQQIDAARQCILATIEAKLGEIRCRMDLIRAELKNRHVERVQIIEVIGVMSGHLTLPGVEREHSDVILKTILEFSAILRESTTDSCLRLTQVLENVPIIPSYTDTRLLLPGKGSA